jgi:predicted phosphoribosyltransferase
MFASREAAGQMLGAHLLEEGVAADLVLGLPRGGVVVAAGVARALGLPLDVLVVRKIGHPLHREFAVGALAEQGVVLLDEAVLRRNPVEQSLLDDVIAEETERLKDYEARFHHLRIDGSADRVMLLIDDGIATGATTEAAVRSAKMQKAGSVIVAAPVASSQAIERLIHVADEVHVLVADPEFVAVGRYYETFSQTTDEEVVELLRAEAARSA